MSDSIFSGDSLSTEESILSAWFKSLPLADQRALARLFKALAVLGQAMEQSPELCAFVADVGSLLKELAPGEHPGPSRPL